MMRAVKGRFDGNVVVLVEPPPVEGEVEVLVQFPDDSSDVTVDDLGRTWHWEQARRIMAGLGTAVSDEVRRQRDLE